MTSPVAAIALDLRAVIDQILAAFDIDFAAARHTVRNLIAIWVLTWLGLQLVKLLARRIVAVANDHHGDTSTFREKRAQTIAQLLRSAGWGVLMLLAIIETLKQFLDVSPYLGGVAVIGLAVSFGAQSLVKDYFAGFFILLENQFIVGDSIEAAGKVGVVEKLTLRTVTLRDIEGTVHIIPNGQITTLSNRTRGWSRAVVDVGISYDNDIDQAIAALSEEAKKLGQDAEWTSRFETAPTVLGVEAFTDTGVSVRTLLQTKPGMQGEVAREYRRRVMIRLEHDGIKGAHSQQVINIHPDAAAGTGLVTRNTPPSVSIVESPSGTSTSDPAVGPPNPNASPIPGST